MATADHKRRPAEVLVRDIMHVGVIGCPASESVAEAARRLVTHRVHALVVGSDPGAGDGARGLRVLADVDLLGALAGGDDPEQLRVDSVAVTDAVTIAASETAREAARLMAEHEVSHLFVLDPQTGRPEGVVSSLDVAASALRHPQRRIGAPTLLVAHDARESGDDAAALARLLSAGNARALAAIVVPFPPGSLGEPTIRAMPKARTWSELCDDLRGQGEELLQRRARPLLEGLEFETRVALDDSPGRSLTRICEEEQPDFVVVGSTHRGRLGRLLPGTTVDRLLNGSPCPVAVAPAGFADRAPDRIATIGVGFDGSEPAARALIVAAELADRHDAALRVIAVVEPAMLGELEVASEALDVISGRGIADRHGEQLRARAAEHLDRVGTGLQATIEIEHGDPAEVLLDAGRRHVDVLALGSRCYGPIRRVLLGSVSTTVTRQASCPVIVTPRT